MRRSFDRVTKPAISFLREREIVGKFKKIPPPSPPKINLYCKIVIGKERLSLSLEKSRELGLRVKIIIFVIVEW